MNKEIIIAGDFNINMLMLNNKPNRLRTTLKSYGFEMHITEKTRQHTCIDQIASNVQGAIGKV